MPKATDIRVIEAVLTLEACPFRTPLKFGGRVMDGARLANVQVTVESRGKKHAVGFGSMPLGAIWAWPSTKDAPAQTEQAMAAFAQELIDIVADFDQFEHPLDLMFDLSGEYDHLGQQTSAKLGLSEPLPRLAQLVAASPLDAAIHDAFGRVNRVNSFNALSKSFMNRDLSEYLDAQFKGEYLDQYTSREPKPSLPLYHLVGALDPLTDADVSKKIGDGLPETLSAWIAAEGITHFKVKLQGNDAAWDLDRMLAVEQVVAAAQAKRGCSQWCYSADFNEQCGDVEYVLEFLKQLQAKSPAAFDRLQYLEQPTHRDLKAHPENRMHAAAAIKPIVIDESLIDYESLLLAREQGYSGVALKACKGQSEALFAAAAAQKFGMYLCVQDLTCPGFSFLHSVSLAARIPTVAAVEGNARQYCPGANKKWARSFPKVFEIRNGMVAAAGLNGEGLGGF